MADIGKKNGNETCENKKGKGLERWPGSSKEYLLFLQKTRIQFLAPTSSSLQLLWTPVPGDPQPPSDLSGHHSTRAYIHVSKTNTHTGKIKIPIKREESLLGVCGCGAAPGSPFRFSLPILSSATGNVGILQLLLHGQGTSHLLALSVFQSSHLCCHAPTESLCAQNSS